jgi:disulfide bond formation protein DsbB
MTTPSYQVALVASAGSLLLLAGAWAFQAMGYAPCAMCIWQRYPHAIAIVIGLLVFLGLRHWGVYLLGAAATATTAAIGIFHTGVERDWWQGPTSCTGSGFDMSTMSAADLLSTDGPTNIVMCDEVAWEFLTLSMASWNAVFSLALTGLWMSAVLMRRP